MQRLRRKLKQDSGGARGEAVFEAVLTSKDPLVIGLMSVLLNSCDKSEVEAFLMRLRQRGMHILTM